MSFLIPFCTRDSGDGRRSTSLCYWESLWDFGGKLMKLGGFTLVHFQLSLLLFSMSHTSFNGVLHDLQSQKADLVNAWVEASDNSVSLQLLCKLQHSLELNCPTSQSDSILQLDAAILFASLNNPLTTSAFLDSLYSNIFSQNSYHSQGINQCLHNPLEMTWVWKAMHWEIRQAWSINCWCKFLVLAG